MPTPDKADLVEQMLSEERLRRAEPLAPPQAREESVPLFAAAIMTVLKEECEREHARAESLLAEKAAAERARDELEQLIDRAREADAVVLATAIAQRDEARKELAERIAARDRAFKEFGHTAVRVDGKCQCPYCLGDAELLAEMAAEYELQVWSTKDEVARLTAQLQEARKDIAGLEERWETHDSTVCPEDVGCVEYIGILKRRLSAAESQLTALHTMLNLCVDHQPDGWEGDGTCALCEGQQLHNQLTALRGAAQPAYEILAALQALSADEGHAMSSHPPTVRAVCHVCGF